jgi:hypothetical protein
LSLENSNRNKKAKGPANRPNVCACVIWDCKEIENAKINAPILAAKGLLKIHLRKRKQVE